jgi:adenine deaminase
MERTRFLLRLFLVLTYTRIAIGESPDTTRLPVVAFVNVNVIPMTSAEVLQHQTVLVERELITRIGPANQIKAPENALRIEGSNRYLLPGLVDAHVHLETALGARPHFGDAPLFLANGVTTVVNLRGSPEHL